MNKSTWMVAIFAASLVTACTNKFSEVSPGSSDPNSTRELQNRVSSKQSLDQKLEDIEQRANQAKNIIMLFKKYQRGSDGDLYTPFNLLADITLELKKGIPDVSQGGYVKKVSLKLSKIVKGLPPECRRIEAMMASDVISLKTCKTNGQFVETFYVEGQNGRVSAIKVRKDAIAVLFPNDGQGEIGKIRDACTFDTSDQGDFKGVACTNLSVSLNSNEVAVIDSLVYDVTADPRLEAFTRVIQQGKPILGLHFRLSKSGIPSFEPIPLDSAPAQGRANDSI